MSFVENKFDNCAILSPAALRNTGLNHGTLEQETQLYPQCYRKVSKYMILPAIYVLTLDNGTLVADLHLLVNSALNR